MINWDKKGMLSRQQKYFEISIVAVKKINNTEVFFRYVQQFENNIILHWIFSLLSKIVSDFMNGLFEGQKMKEWSFIFIEIAWLCYVHLWRQWNSYHTATEEPSEFKWLQKIQDSKRHFKARGDEDSKTVCL